jgi:hypothetical protein
MKTSNTIVAALLLGISSGFSTDFTECYSAAHEMSEAACVCTDDGCIYFIFTPQCWFCLNHGTRTGKTCYEGDSYTVKRQEYGPSGESETRCVNGICTGGAKVGPESDYSNCKYTTESPCSE